MDYNAVSRTGPSGRKWTSHSVNREQDSELFVNRPTRLKHPDNTFPRKCEVSGSPLTSREMITYFDWFCFEPLILNSLHGDTGYSLPRRKNHGWQNLCPLSESVSEFTWFRLNIRQLVRLSKKSFSKLFFPYFCFVDPANHPPAVDTRSSYNFVVRNDQRWQSFHHTVVTFSDSQKGILIRTPQFLWSVILISILPEYFRARLVLVSFEGLRVIPYDRINQSEGAAVS